MRDKGKMIDNKKLGHSRDFCLGIPLWDARQLPVRVPPTQPNLEVVEGRPAAEAAAPITVRQTVAENGSDNLPRAPPSRAPLPPPPPPPSPLVQKGSGSPRSASHPPSPPPFFPSIRPQTSH